MLDEAISKNLDISSKQALYQESLKLVREKAKSNFLTFVRYLEPSFSIAPHHRIIADKLERIETGEIDRQIISMPPRSGKSRLVSVYYPAWCLGRHPRWEILSVSYAAELAYGFGREVRNLISSERYQEIFPGTELREDSRAAGRWHTSSGGVYTAAGAGGGIAGRGANVIIIDDPISEQDAKSRAALQKILDWYPVGLRSRLMPKGRILLTMTRWSTIDLAGFLLEKQKSDPHADIWQDLKIPAILEPGYEAEAKLLGLPMGGSYWPESASDYTEESAIPYWPLEELLKTKANTPPRDWECVYQQNPTPEAGQIFNVDNFRRWDKEYPKCHFIVQSYDTAFGKGETNDYTAITTWGIFRHEGANHIMLLDMDKARYDFPELSQKAMQLYGMWEPDVVLIEKKASGQSLLQVLQRMNVPLQSYTPDKDKRARANACTVLVDAERIWVPYGKEWAETFLTDLALFGTPGVHDDVVDSTTQALQFIINGNLINLAPGFLDDEEDFIETEHTEQKYERYW
jgi:predicted phage terminase large subunit-like protein